MAYNIMLCYTASFVVVLIAGFFCPFGPLGLPVWAGLIAVLGTLSPLISTEIANPAAGEFLRWLPQSK
jgi:hypothetical protein